MDRIRLKQQAKDSLRGKYAEAVIVILIIGFFGLISGGITELGDHFQKPFISLSGSILGLIIDGLFGFGLMSFFLKISRDEEVEFKELFSKMHLFLPYILLSLLVGICIMAGCILFIIPGIILALGYSQTLLIALENPDIDPIDAMRESRTLMKGHKLDYLILNLSFLGWMIIGIFTFGILYFWLIPYMSVTQMNFYNALLEEKNR